MGWPAVAAAAVTVVGGALMSDSNSGGDGGNYAANVAAGISNEQWQHYKDAGFMGLETGLVNEVKDKGGLGDQELAAASAGADSAAAYRGSADALTRSKLAAGVGDPSSPNFRSDQASLALAGAGATAGAENAARRTAQLTGFGQRMDVAGLGRGIPGQATAGLLGAANSQASQYRNTLTERGLQADALAPIANAAAKGAEDWWKSRTPSGSSPTVDNTSTNMFAGQKPAADPFNIKNGGLVRGFAMGGPVEGPGTSTSDSIPATIEGDQPAALSNGEHVVNAEGVEVLSRAGGPEFLDVINMLGLMTRYQSEHSPQAPQSPQPTQAMSRGGLVRRRYADGGEVQEQEFQKWYAERAARNNLDPNPDAPEHYYDYRAAHAAGAEPNAEGHWPSAFKREGHPRMIIDGVNTKTGERYASGGRVGANMRNRALEARDANALRAQVEQPIYSDSNPPSGDLVPHTARAYSRLPDVPEIEIGRKFMDRGILHDPEDWRRLTTPREIAKDKTPLANGGLVRYASGGFVSSGRGGEYYDGPTKPLMSGSGQAVGAGPGQPGVLVRDFGGGAPAAPLASPVTSTTPPDRFPAQQGTSAQQGTPQRPPVIIIKVPATRSPRPSENPEIMPWQRAPLDKGTEIPLDEGAPTQSYSPPLVGRATYDPNGLTGRVTSNLEEESDPGEGNVHAGLVENTGKTSARVNSQKSSRRSKDRSVERYGETLGVKPGPQSDTPTVIGDYVADTKSNVDEPARDVMDPKLSFKQAWDTAINSPLGLKTFSWRGRTYDIETLKRQFGYRGKGFKDGGLVRRVG